jgi:hypothetical protein
MKVKLKEYLPHIIIRLIKIKALKIITATEAFLNDVESAVLEEARGIKLSGTMEECMQPDE